MPAQTRDIAKVIKTDLSTYVKNPGIQKRFEEVLGQRAPLFTSSLLSLASQDRQLASAEPSTVVSAAMKAACLDLPIDKNLGFAWVIAYNDKHKGKAQAQFQMGYKGYVQLAMRTGQYAGLNVVEVREGELKGFDQLRAEAKIEWLPPDQRESAKIVGFVAWMKLVNGFEHSEYWTLEKVQAHAQRYSQSYRKGYDSPWKSDFEQMAKKTVLKHLLSNWGPLSVQMQLQEAIKVDQSTQSDLDADIEYIDNPSGNPEPKEAEVIDVGAEDDLTYEKEPEAVPAEDQPAELNLEEESVAEAPETADLSWAAEFIEAVGEDVLTDWLKERGAILANQTYADLQQASVTAMIKNPPKVVKFLKEHKIKMAGGN